MSITVNSEFDRLKKRLSQMSAEAEATLTEIMQDVTQDGEDDVRVSILTTPSGIVPGKPDRVWTGNMMDKVTTKVETKGSKVIGEYGWLDINDYEEDYIRGQEYGSQRVAFGMRSLFHSYTVQRERLIARIQEVFK